jgi:hypothetical protein
MAKWKKAGTVWMSKSKKVVLVSVDGLEGGNRFVVDIGELFDVIEGSRRSTALLEVDEDVSDGRS